MFERILIATFSLRKNGERTATNGMIEPLISFFSSKAKHLDLIDGPHPGSSTTITTIESYFNGKQIGKTYSYLSAIMKPFLDFCNRNDTQILFKIRDILATIEWVIRTRYRYSLFIGLESIYSFVGIILKKFHVVETVVYYVSDYSPNRYVNPLVNKIYLLLDRFCCYHADVIWDVSPAMMPARIKAGLTKKCAPLIIVPNALWPKQIIKKKPKTIPHSLVYAGTFGPENGPQIIISALPAIIKQFPDTTFHLVGPDDEEKVKLIQQAKTLCVEKFLHFYPFVSDQIKLSHLISKYLIGLAPYPNIAGSPRLYADATKIRLYLGAGVPVITTYVPPLGNEIKKVGAALVIRDSSQDFAKAIIRLFSDTRQCIRMSKQAMIYAKSNTWNNTYTHALKQIGK
jgi:glycosyltransferase involved in cell wall biosynthesis